MTGLDRKVFCVLVASLAHHQRMRQRVACDSPTLPPTSPVQLEQAKYVKPCRGPGQSDLLSETTYPPFTLNGSLLSQTHKLGFSCAQPVATRLN